ncbi:hypothetical protein GH733_017222 [Mirounga leonina]|nr:hypothetical protein GH733_017222 [Mirounga leonina]
MDTSSEITTKDLKEKKEVVERAENGRDAPANGNANEENGEQEADNEVDEEEEKGDLNVVTFESPAHLPNRAAPPTDDTRSPPPNQNTRPHK